MRFGHFAAGAPNVDVFIDGDAALTDVEPEMLSDFLEVEPGSLTIAIAPADEDADSAIFPPQDVMIETDHGGCISLVSA